MLQRHQCSMIYIIGRSQKKANKIIWEPEKANQIIGKSQQTIQFLLEWIHALEHITYILSSYWVYTAVKLCMNCILFHNTTDWIDFLFWTLGNLANQLYTSLQLLLIFKELCKTVKVQNSVGFALKVTVKKTVLANNDLAQKIIINWFFKPGVPISKVNWKKVLPRRCLTSVANGFFDRGLERENLLSNISLIWPTL